VHQLVVKRFQHLFLVVTLLSQMSDMWSNTAERSVGAVGYDTVKSVMFWRGILPSCSE